MTKSARICPFCGLRKNNPKHIHRGCEGLREMRTSAAYRKALREHKEATR